MSSLKSNWKITNTLFNMYEFYEPFLLKDYNKVKLQISSLYFRHFKVDFIKIISLVSESLVRI